MIGRLGPLAPFQGEKNMSDDIKMKPADRLRDMATGENDGLPLSSTDRFLSQWLAASCGGRMCPDGHVRSLQFAIWEYLYRINAARLLDALPLEFMSHDRRDDYVERLCNEQRAAMDDAEAARMGQSQAIDTDTMAGQSEYISDSLRSIAGAFNPQPTGSDVGTNAAGLASRINAFEANDAVLMDRQRMLKFSGMWVGVCAGEIKSHYRLAALSNLYNQFELAHGNTVIRFIGADGIPV